MTTATATLPTGEERHALAAIDDAALDLEKQTSRAIPAKARQVAAEQSRTTFRDRHPAFVGMTIDDVKKIAWLTLLMVVAYATDQSMLAPITTYAARSVRRGSATLVPYLVPLAALLAELWIGEERRKAKERAATSPFGDQGTVQRWTRLGVAFGMAIPILNFSLTTLVLFRLREQGTSDVKLFSIFLGLLVLGMVSGVVHVAILFASESAHWLKGLPLYAIAAAWHALRVRSARARHEPLRRIVRLRAQRIMIMLQRFADAFGYRPEIPLAEDVRRYLRDEFGLFRPNDDPEHDGTNGR